MRKIAVAVISSMLFLVACSENEYVTKIKLLEKRSCSCQNQKCAKEVATDFFVLVQDMKTKNAQVSREDGEIIGSSTSTLVKCLMSNGFTPSDIQKEMNKIK